MEDASYRTPFYTWEGDDGPQMTIGLKGHVLNPAFPEDYKSWQQIDPRDLIDAPLIKQPTDKNVVKAIKKVAKDAKDLVIATDFDREGELIGLEALQEIVESNPRARDRRGRPRGRHPGQARPLLRPDQGGDRARLRRARRALDAARQRRRRPPGHRPDLGRDPDRAVSRATRRFGSMSALNVQSLCFVT